MNKHENNRIPRNSRKWWQVIGALGLCDEGTRPFAINEAKRLEAEEKKRDKQSDKAGQESGASSS